MAIDNFLISSTVKIGQYGNLTYGAGFYIDEHHILTCHHCIEDLNHKMIECYQNGEKFFSRYIKSEYSTKYDVALLRTNRKSSKAVYLDSTISNNDKVIYFGFSDINPNGETVGLTYEGISINSTNFKLLKFKDGVVRKGHSGSAILNSDTGKIIGIIRETENSSIPVGGYGILMENIILCYPNVFRLNLNFHLLNPSWSQEIQINKKGILSYDCTLNSKHFKVFNTDISIDDIFINPKYKILTYIDFEYPKELKISKNVIDDSYKILKRIKLLLILGAFGTGKTIVTKMLQKRLDLLRCKYFCNFAHYENIN